MSEIKFTCPHCQQPLEATPEYFGLDIECPSCSKPLKVPSQARPIIIPPKIKTTIPTTPKALAATPPQNTGYVKRFIFSALRWLLYIPAGIFITNLAITIVYLVANFIDSFMPEELSGLIATRATLVVVIPLIATISYGISYIAPKPKFGAILYALCFGALRYIHITYFDESIGYALLYFAPVLAGVYFVLKEKNIGDSFEDGKNKE